MSEELATFPVVLDWSRTYRLTITNLDVFHLLPYKLNGLIFARKAVKICGKTRRRSDDKFKDSEEDN